MKWRLVWMPEGREIAASIEARNAREARRKAPRPYRKYLGEIYVERTDADARRRAASLGRELRRVSTPSLTVKERNLVIRSYIQHRLRRSLLKDE